MAQSGSEGSLNTTGADAPLKQKKKLLNGPHFVFTYPNGSVYEGAFKDGKLHGFGVYKYSPSGDVYEGGWKADMKHGHGKYTFAGGDSYIGSWYMGKKHGKGKFSFASGDEYYGGWKADVMDGFGVFRLERNGDQYEGFWQQGLREGLGILRSGSGSVYDGEWSAGKEEGFGVLQDVSGAIYCGSWKAGLKDGKGVEQDKGATFLVEHLGGYLISKLPYLPEQSCDSEWTSLLQHMDSWVAPPPLTFLPSGFAERLDADAVDALRSTLDGWKSAYLSLFERLCQQQQQQQQGSQAHEEERLTPDARTMLEMKHHAELLKGRIQLLEAALGERMLEIRRMQEELRERDTVIQDLKYHVARLQGNRKKSVLLTGSGFNIAVNGHPPAAAESETIDEGEDQLAAAAATIAELQKQNAVLSQTNYTQQQKLTVLSAENTKLSSDVTTLEDNVKEMEELLTSLLMGADGRQNGAGRDSDDDPGVADHAVEEMPESELRKRLREVNQRNAELLVSHSTTEKELEHVRDEVAALKKQLKDSLNAQAAAVADAVEAATAAVKAELNNGNGPYNGFTAAPPPDWRKDAERDVIDANVIVNDSLLNKEKRIADLQKENAELARLVEEYRFQLEEPTAPVASPEKKKRKPQRSPSEEKVSNKRKKSDSEEVDKSDAELKKTKKKLKKMVEERNDLALELYNAQCNLARVNRAPLFLHGQLVVAVVVQDQPPPKESEVVARIKDADPTQIEVSGVSRTFRFDVCFGQSTNAEHIFLDVKQSLVFAAQGFQAGFVGFGGSLPGARSVLGDLLPFLVEGLRSECTVHDQGKTQFRVAYRVAAVEIDATGAHDCFSGKQLSEVVKDVNGYVKPGDVSFVDCGADRLVDLLKQPLTAHTSPDNLSHLWMQIQVMITHKTEQTTRCGRVTVLDVGGLTPSDELDSYSAASARYMKRSMRQIDDLISAMQTDANTIPYSTSVETALLYDLLGGNSMTTVIGSVLGSHPDQKEQTLAGLAALESLGKLRNGPYLQDFVSSDVLRWREIVSAVSSTEQALPEYNAIEDLAL